MACRVLVAVAFACLVVLFAIAVRPPDPPRTTVGHLSANPTSPPGLYRISNAAWGVHAGDYIVFRQPAAGRMPVVMLITFAEGNPDTFTGFVEGVSSVPLPGCPCDPPFVYVTGCRSCPND